jgi:hypothetical protein
MKKILVFLLCAILLCTMPIVAFAEGETADAVVEEGPVSESVPEKTVTETIVDYVKSHIEEFSVIITLLLTVFYEVRKHRNLNGSIGTLNNNAIAVAEKSATAVKEAFAKVEDMATVVKDYKDDIVSLLDEIRNSEEEKKALQEALVRVESYINKAKLANVEFAHELAELLCLSNIPNSKKEELYARHIQSVRSLEAAEDEGVKADDGTET